MNMPSKLTIAKGVIHGVLLFGVTKVTTDIVSHNTDPETLADKAAVKVGGAVIGSCVAAAASTSINNQIDDIVGIYTTIKSAQENIETIEEVEVVE